MLELCPVARSRARVAHAALLVACAAVLLVPSGRAGVLVPFELDAADLGRRIAATRFGATHLLAPGDVAPTLGDLGMGELPFTAMALAFRALGLGAAVGRLPVAIFALAGAAAVWAFSARFARPRVAAAAVVVLVTCPLFALHARTMIGDGVTLGSFALAWCGLAGAQIEHQRRRVAGWLAAAALGLVAGYLARGALLGLAAPLLAAGLGGLVARRGEGAPRDRAAWVLLALGAGAVVAFVWRASPVAAARGDDVLRAVGMTLDGAPAEEATFDRTVRQIGHAVFPWSAFLPLAIGRLFARPPSPPSGAAETPPAEGDPVRLHVLAALVVTLLATAAVVPWSGDLPWIGVPAVAIAIGVAIDDLADRGPVDATAALVTVALGAVIALDLVRDPDRALAALSVADAGLPPGLEARATPWIAAAALGTLVPLGVAMLPAVDLPEGGPSALARRLRRRAALARRVVLEAWDGWLAFLLVVVEAALAGLAAMVLAGRWLGWDVVLRLSRPTTRLFLHGFWLVPAMALALPAIVIGARVALALVARRLATSVPAVALALAGAAAAAYAVGFHGEVAARSSPEEALDAHAALRRDGEPLGLFGFGAELARFHGAHDARLLADVDEASAWLVGGAPGERRWMVLPAAELPRLNAAHRARGGRNVPVARATGEAVLVASDLRGAPDENPLRDVVLDEVPTPQRRVEADLDGALQLLGWEVRDAAGALVTEVSAGPRYHARFFLRSTAPLATSYRPFLHVERAKLRWNGDDTFVDRAYPASLWRTGDVVVLACDVQLEPNFGPGAYDVWFGFFAPGGRLPVLAGPARGDRVHMGTLAVR